MSSADPELRCPNGCHPRYLSYQQYRDTKVSICKARHQGSTTRWWIVCKCGECGEPEVYLENVSDEQKKALDESIRLAFVEMQDLEKQMEDS